MAESDSCAEETRPLVLSTSEQQPDSLRSRRVVIRKLLRGLGAGICILLVVSSWAIMAEKLQDLGETYHQPFFQTYWIHSAYAIMYIAWKVWMLFPGGYSCNRAGEGTLTNARRLFLLGGFLAACSFASGLLWYISLSRTSVAANTAIYQSASAVVFIMSIPLLREKVTVVKTLCVILTIAGVCLVSLFSSHEGDDSKHSNVTEMLTLSGLEDRKQLLASDDESRSTPVGYICVLFSMILYAAYETFFKKFGTRSDDTAPVWNGVRMIGYVGVHTVFMYWPVLIIVHFMGVERFLLPNLKQFQLLVGMTCLDIIFNASLFVCIALSTPLLASPFTG